MATIVTEKGNTFGLDFKNTRFVELHIVNKDGKKGREILISLKENSDVVVVNSFTSRASTEGIVEIILGCFEKESNFFSYLEKALKVTLCKDKIILGTRWGQELATITPDTNPKWVLKEKNYYLVDIKNLSTNISEKRFVFAYDEEHATDKVTAKYPNSIIKLIGVYSKKTNSFTLKNADEYFNFGTENIID